jgi:hypothetical protein
MRSALRVDMDPLFVPSDVSKQIDDALVDRVPRARAQRLSDPVS